MKNITSKLAKLFNLVVGLGFLGSVLLGSVLHAQNRTEAESPGEDSERIRTVDHFVPHISTVPANAGEEVQLFVREKVRGPHRRHRPVVLMVQGGTQPTILPFDLPFQDYSWMAFLARAGFDVFAMDLQGYGLSTRPMVMGDPCNTSLTEQTQFLIPNPLPEPCPPSYPFRLTTIQSDWDEMDTVVDYLRQLRGVEKVSLVGWSRGGPRAGGYAARHPEKVEKLFLYAPSYDRMTPSDPPEVLPEPGVPMTVVGLANFTLADLMDCENQFDPAIEEVIVSTTREIDPLGGTWGTAGVRRAPVWNSPWGWNPAFAAQIAVPTLIIVGDLDTVTGVMAGRNLYDDLLMDSKVFVHVACGKHTMVWENQHRILLGASKEWLRHGTFAGQRQGSFSVDTEERIHRE